MTKRPEIKALIIDDEIDIRFLLGSLLKFKNVQASYAGSLSEAENILQNESPALIFLDNHLPDGRGIGFIKRLKKKHPRSKVIMITAHDNTSDRDKARIEGADFFIGKPFTRDAVFKTLENCRRQIG